MTGTGTPSVGVTGRAGAGSASSVQWPYSLSSSTHTWSSRLGQGNFQVTLGTLDSASKQMWQAGEYRG